MKPQQLSNEAIVQNVLESVQDHVRCAKATLPTLTTIALAIASSIVLTLGGCA